MAISASTVFEVQTGGSDTNGGGFVTGSSGTDWSQQTSPQYSVTDGVTAGTTTITSAAAAFGTDVVGNLIYVSGGTGSITAGWYQIVTRTNSTTITVDRSTGLSVGTGATLHIGGALVSLGQAAGIAVAFNAIYVKSGSYTISSSSSNVSNGRVTLASQVRAIGYQTTRLDNGTSPVLTASGIASVTLVNVGVGGIAQNIKVNGASLTGIQGFAVNTGNSACILCTAINCPNSGFLGSSEGLLLLCYASGCAGTGAFQLAGVACLYCVATANTVAGFDATGSCGTCQGCISYANTTSNGHGFNTIRTAHISNCVAYGNGGSGFRESSNPERVRVTNSISVLNGAYGFEFGSAGGAVVTFSATYSNTTAAFQNAASIATGNLILTGDPFTNAGSGDFSLNKTAGAGAACRGAGIPGPFPGGLTTGYIDIGAAQSQSSGGGLLRNPGMSGGING